MYLAAIVGLGWKDPRLPTIATAYSLSGVFPGLFAEGSSATNLTTTLGSTPKSAINPPRAALVQHESANGGSTATGCNLINDRHLAALFDLLAKRRLQQLLEDGVQVPKLDLEPLFLA